MFFGRCPLPLGCTILLFGEDDVELSKIKNVVKHAVFAAHHMRLERALIDAEDATISKCQLERISKV